MSKLTRKDLWSLEDYAANRQAFREKVMAHKQHRQVAIGDHARLYFEDEMTIRYQIQEMLRIEKVFEAVGIQDELDAYNPLIPNGSNWKATFMLEYDDVEERRKMVKKLLSIEDQVWMKVGNHPPVYAIADEDMDRADDEKTSTVHFMRFELTPDMAAAAKAGEPITAGIDHPAMKLQTQLNDASRQALVNDLD